MNKAPPRELTMEEYERDWKPQGWQLIIIGPTSTWRQEWGEWEAIRDITQNALDEAEAYQWGYDDGLWISDMGKGVQVADFLLGPPKLKPEWARGKFGEGMKIASLALIRKGYPVHVKTVGRELWLTFIQQKVNGMASTLAAIWHPDGTTIGTRFHIVGYNGPAFEDRFAVNLPRRYVVWESPSPITTPKQRNNELIQYPFEDGSRIFARDIFTINIDSPYSYNLWGFEMAPDRHGPKSESDMWIDVGRLWSCVNRVELLETFLKMVREPPLLESAESRLVEMGSWSMGVEPTSQKRYVEFVRNNASAWQRAWSNAFGENVVIRTSDRWDGSVKHLGYSSLSLHHGVVNTLPLAIKTDSELVKSSQERLSGVKIIPDERLTAGARSHIRLSRVIASRLYKSPPGGIHAAIIPPASDVTRTAGMFQRSVQSVYISLEQLERASTTVDTLIHELAHYASGYEDLEKGHANEMTRLAGEIVSLTARRQFDEYLKEVVW